MTDAALMPTIGDINQYSNIVFWTFKGIHFTNPSVISMIRTVCGNLSTCTFEKPTIHCVYVPVCKIICI